MPRPRRKADFPAVEDLTGVPGVDEYDASRALTVLYRLACADLAKVYTQPYTLPSERPRWTIWLEITQRSVPLREWAREWLLSQEEQPEGDDVA